ncbi:MAG: hypothetical protein IK138_00150 [Lachnospiraceae bacterium]|nr:hypothetical protein [Lachnospiraceae bacterium]MBR5367666.1 hypothetical protein [Lachnospiraceae bacterium]
MKYETDEAIRMIEKKALELKIKQLRTRIGILSGVALTVVVFSVALLYQLSGFGSPDSIQMYGFGALMLSDDAGGYVLVGVLSFVLAVVITLGCIKGVRIRREKQLERETEIDDPDG